MTKIGKHSKQVGERVARRLAEAYKARHMTRGMALTECSKVVDMDAGMHAWRIFRKLIKEV